jgi:VanZ family protein
MVVSRRRPWLAAAAVAGGVVLASLVPAGVASVGDSAPPAPVGVDKVAHAAGYGLLAGVLVVALAARARARGRDRPARTAALAWALATALGAGVELLQTTRPTRTGDPLDAAANAVGAVLVAGAWLVWANA